MKKSAATKLAKLFLDIERTDDWQPFSNYLKKCTESDLREAFGDNKNILTYIVFGGLEDSFQYVSEDFIKQMFVNLQQDDKKYLQDQVYQQLYCIGTDIYNDNKNTLMHFGEYANWIFKVGNYIRYCNPKNERLVNQYWFIMNQAHYYMNTDRLFE